MRIIYLLLAGMVIAFSGCNSGAEENQKPVISVSIIPQKYFIEYLVGEDVNVNVMVPPGSSPATYDPSPKQLKDLDRSELYLKIGNLGFENAWLPKFQENYKDLKIIDLSTGIDPVETNIRHGDHFHLGDDPHIWMSPRTALIMADNIAKTLTRFDPACKDMIARNMDSLKTVLAQLDQDFQAMASKLENKKFIIFHPALSYLARDYGLEQIPMEYEGKEPSAAYMKELVDKAKSENIKTVFIQKEFDQERARQLSRELDANLIQIDPLAEDWLKQMKELLNSFTD